MRLYSKFMLWSVLNLVWLGVVSALAGSWLLLGSQSLFPHSLFRGDINSIMQVVAVNLQYKPAHTWTSALENYSASYGIRFKIHDLLPSDKFPGNNDIPGEVIEAARKIPRPPVALCPEPLQPEQPDAPTNLEYENGFLPLQNALYLRAGHPTQYWYGRPLFLPDQNHDLHYALLVASSPSFSGNGLYFNYTGALAVMFLVLVLSFLWWWPFVLHITKPIAAITESAERIAAGDYTSQDSERPTGGFTIHRRDEIRRLSDAVGSMSSQLMRQMFGQRRFIRHIAHELGSPIARVKFGLAVMESRLEGENCARIRVMSKDMEQIAGLVEDVLSYLRAEGLPGKPRTETFPLSIYLKELVELEGQNAQVNLDLPASEILVRTDLSCLRRAVSNVLRNAVRYAGSAGPITVTARQAEQEAVIRVEDCGNGVPADEILHLTEPFFRGREAEGHPGGSGLGLSIVKYCLEICGGRLDFANRQPHGFCVTLRVPLARTAPSV